MHNLIHISSTTTPLCFDTIKSTVDTIKENIIAEKLYGAEIDSVVKNISATEALLEEVLPLHKILPKQEPRQTASVILWIAMIHELLI